MRKPEPHEIDAIILMVVPKVLVVIGILVGAAITFLITA